MSFAERSFELMRELQKAENIPPYNVCGRGFVMYLQILSCFCHCFCHYLTIFPSINQDEIVRKVAMEINAHVKERDDIMDTPQCREVCPEVPTTFALLTFCHETEF
jgi:hypothetical protein